jgi:hypothetical protein
VKPNRHLNAGAIFVALAAIAAPAHADGFVTPYGAYNFGGDSGSCPYPNCSEQHTNYGVAFGAMGTVFGIEEDIGFAKNFFPSRWDNSVFSAMTNLVVGVGVGPVLPYVLGGLGRIRSHVSVNVLCAVADWGPFSANTSLGYDLGGGVRLSAPPHIGIRGDLRHLHTLQDVNFPDIFAGQHLGFNRVSIGLSLKF